VELVSITHKNISFITIFLNIYIMDQNMIQQRIKCDEMGRIVNQSRITTWK